MEKWQNRFLNFEKSFNTLTEDIEKFNQNKHNKDLYYLLRAGLIHVYEHTLELSWKTLKDYFEDQGFTDINSPKKVIRTAFTQEYIKDGESWLAAFDDRNLVAHDYDEDIAEKVVVDIIENYYFLIRDLYFVLKQECE